MSGVIVDPGWRSSCVPLPCAASCSETTARRSMSFSNHGRNSHRPARCRCSRVISGLRALGDDRFVLPAQLAGLPLPVGEIGHVVFASACRASPASSPVGRPCTPAFSSPTRRSGDRLSQSSPCVCGVGARRLLAVQRLLAEMIAHSLRNGGQPGGSGVLVEHRRRRPGRRRLVARCA